MLIYMNLKGHQGGGGPIIFAHKMAKALRRAGHKIIYNDPEKADVALCIIESGKILRRVDRSKTKVVVRLDGAYFKEYWHGNSEDRKWRPDMTALHNAIIRDVAEVDTMIYQSNFSKNLIDEEIASRDSDYAVIHNGVDTGLFKPLRDPDDIYDNIRLVHVGLMRNKYIMESLIESLLILREKLGHPDAQLTVVGSMDKECKQVYSQHAGKGYVYHKPPVKNSSLVIDYNKGDIYMGPRQGSSSDNVIAEAQACGLPVIIPSWGGNTDMVKDKETGVVVPTGHWDYTSNYHMSIADAVEEISKDLPSYKRRARQHAKQNLTIERMVDKYIKAMGL